MSKNQLETSIYKKWFYPVLREVVGLDDFQEDAEWIQSKLRILLSHQDIVEGLNFLEENQFLHRDKLGRLRQAKPYVLSSEMDICKSEIEYFHKNMMRETGRAFAELEKSKRNVSALTLHISEDEWVWINNRIQEFKENVREFLHRGEDVSDRVVQLNLSLLPLSNI
jgi:uncharacterized protein (TIGR02147 family)